MTRWRLTLEYDGTPFVGWQRQDNGPSVQEALETAATRFCQETPRACAGGRTDGGVHARAMTAHLDIEKPTTADVLRDALNHHLRPAPIVVLDAREAPPDFHARFSARARRYEYLILNRRAPSALDAGRVWRLPARLDAAAMHAAAQVLVGAHDFSTFRAAQCQAKSPVKTLSEIAVTRRRDIIAVHVAAPSFLHHQVRSIVGSLVNIGVGRWSARDLGDALAACDRRRCGQVAPAAGLYFLCAVYDSDAGEAR